MLVLMAACTGGGGTKAKTEHLAAHTNPAVPQSAGSRSGHIENGSNTWPSASMIGSLTPAM